MHACARACVRTYARVCVCVCVYECVRDCERDCVRARIHSVRVRVDQARLLLFVVLVNCNASCQPYCATGVTESHIFIIYYDLERLVPCWNGFSSTTTERPSAPGSAAKMKAVKSSDWQIWICLVMYNLPNIHFYKHISFVGFLF